MSETKAQIMLQRETTAQIILLRNTFPMAFENERLKTFQDVWV